MDFKIQPVSDFGVEIAKFGGTAYVKATALPSTPCYQLSRGLKSKTRYDCNEVFLH